MRSFSLKFIDIMVGVVLGLGFQWWPALREPWQYAAFVFSYLDIVDYWIDYGPALKKFPPKREIDVLLDVAIVFTLFLYIYTTQLMIAHFLGAFFLLRIFDYFWLLSSKYEYRPTGVDKTFVDTWLRFDVVEAVVTLAFIGLALVTSLSPSIVLAGFIVFRIVIRVFASRQYKKVHFA